MAAKLYQYLQGQNRGKIVSLTGIEPEDGVTYLTFDDGSRCNVEFAAKLNDARAFTDGKFVAEVCDRTNIWTFEDKSIKEEIRYGTLKDTGEQVQGWDPYVHGQYGNENKARKSVKAIPPRHVVTKEEMVSGSERLKELGIDPNTPGYEEGLRNMTIPSQQSLLGNLVGKGGFLNKTGGNYENVESEGTTMQLDPTGAQAPSLKDMEEFIRSTELYIPSNINESVEEKKVEISHPKIEVAQPVVETVEQITEKRFNGTKTEVSEEETKPKYNYQSPVYNILRSCRKKDVVVPLELNLKIPGKKIYNMIKEDFNDECLDEFFDILLAELDVTEIKNCLKESLKDAYEMDEEATIQPID